MVIHYGMVDSLLCGAVLTGALPASTALPSLAELQAVSRERIRFVVLLDNQALPEGVGTDEVRDFLRKWMGHYFPFDGTRA